MDMQRVIDELAEKHGLLHKSGKVNYTVFARQCGLPPPTILRWHKGFTKDITVEAAEKVANAFGVSAAQVRGLEPLSGGSGPAEEYELRPADLKFLAQLRSLPTEDQFEIERWIGREARQA